MKIDYSEIAAALVIVGLASYAVAWALHLGGL